jgi:hypothetical protein
MYKRLISTIAAASVAGCVTVDYPNLRPGFFKGSVIVLWIGEGDSSGDGKFLFIPDPRDRLIFYRPDKTQPGAEIRPSMMYTDGGSIPKIAQVFNGLSPWGYAPAYMIHDWLFIAHHCLVDGASSPNIDVLQSVSFEASAEILGEAIQALVAQHQVKQRDIAAGAITSAVGSGIAKDLWDKRGACEENRIRPEHIAAAESAVPGSAQTVDSSLSPKGRIGTFVRAPAKFVARVKF